ncbi:MAG: DUF4019 domain-containing protein [Opitutaceae bacterium]|jgi:serine/threonine-protein kinase|nr:DUF4019 domain-containing protein [Opitutaceae bacterium]
MSTPSASSPPDSGSARNCPQCGRPVPPGAALGLCPACLLAAGLPTQPHNPAPPPPAPSDIAAEFPQLDILALLGRGGMGAVYKARQRDLDRIVALKILRPGLDADPTFADRFRHEARALAQLNHPGIVTLYETGRTPGGLYFILMEFVDGLTLRQLLDTRAGPLPAREALEIVPQICDALQYAHDRGVVHRDIKPENILLDRQGHVKVADFGLARIAVPRGAGIPPASPQPESTSPSPDAGLPTRPGKIMGTPAYMAPEQTAASGEVDHRADIYALGVVLYQMLTGELPPSARPLAPPSKKVHIDVRLDEIVLRALEQNPARRYEQASELKTQVETVTRSSRTSRLSCPAPPLLPPPGGSGDSGRTSDQHGLQANSPRDSRPRLRPHPLRLPSCLLAIFAALFLGLLVVSVYLLPDPVATHFGGNGAANDWISRTPYLLFTELIGIGIPFFICCLFFALGHMPARAFNLPHRDYWFAPERRRATNLFLLRHGLWLALLALCFITCIHILIIAANRLPSPPSLSGRWLAALVITDFSLASLWLFSFLRPFLRKPPRPLPDAIPHRPFPHLLLVALVFGGFSGSIATASRILGAPRTTNPAPISAPPVATDPARLRFLREAIPVTVAGISAELRQAVAGLVPDSAIQVSDGKLQITSGTVRLTLERITRPPEKAFSTPEVTRGEHSFMFVNAGFDAAAGEGARVELVCTAAPPDSDPLLKALMLTSIAWLHTGQETLVDHRGEPLRVNTEIFLDGSALDSVEIRPSPSPEHGKHEILFRFTTEGVFRLDQLFQTARKRRIAIVLDQRVLSSPTVMADSAPSTVSFIADLFDEEAALLTGLPRAAHSSGRASPPERNSISSAVESARVWLQRIDAGPDHYAQSWREASAGFRATVAEAEWVTTLKAGRPSLGSVASRRLVSTQETHTLPGAPDGHYVVMRFATDFTRQKSVIETVTFSRESDGAWRASGYYLH